MVNDYDIQYKQNGFECIFYHAYTGIYLFIV